MARFRVGIDVGGTFTDAVMLSEETGELTIAKVPTVPLDSSGAVEAAVREVTGLAGVAMKDVALLSHGTTIVTNAVLEGKLPRTALVTTDGFRDVLEIGRHLRRDMYSLSQDKIPPIVPRDLRFEVRERMAPDGTALVRLEQDSMRRVAEQIKASEVESVAVTFLHAYADSANEEAMKAYLRSELPQVHVSTSSEVCREIREFERSNTVALNAAAIPVVARYLEALSKRIAASLPQAQLLLIQSNGGSMTASTARQLPAHLVYSGPAGGVLAIQFIGKLAGHDHVLGFDMGGTSTDISIVYDGAPRMTTEGGIAGYPVKLPMLDIATIGAGGGSIAWLDSGSGLRVGPRSAGAEPGPVAYGRGGTEPTVTDANLVLGRLDPGHVLGGKVRLNTEAALAAIRDRVAAPLGMDPIRAAWGIVRIANANMERALRVKSAERGYDPREITLVAFGGAGPLHAVAVAEAVGFPRVLVPEAPGVFSALGLVLADIRHDFVQSQIARDVSAKTLAPLFAALEKRGAEALRADGIPPADWLLQRSADLRYVGQAYEVNVPVGAGELNANSITQVIERFHAEHFRLYAHNSPGEPVELVSARLAAIGRVKRPPFAPRPSTAKAVASSRSRPVYFEEENGFVECSIYDRTTLGPGATFAGPAIVEQMDSTTVVHPRQSVSVDAWGNLIIEMAK